MVIFAEHRYYGQSLPYGNKSLTPGLSMSFYPDLSRFYLILSAFIQILIRFG
jgi:hypothetical protein